MNRRGFLGGLGVLGLAGTGCVTAGNQSRVKADGRELIELKMYKCSSVAKRDALMELFDTAMIPALRRQGISKTGVFWTDASVNNGNSDYDTTVFLLVPHADADSWLACESRLLHDKLYMQAAKTLFEAPMGDPLYDSCTASVLRGFATCPQVERVSNAATRLLQLRIYNSYTTERNASKIAMFEQGGELAIFRECNMLPVFFGEGVAGGQLPNLTYMLGFADKAAKEAAWKKFISHPAWLKLKVDPLYKDTANKILNIDLRPSNGSVL